MIAESEPTSARAVPSVSARGLATWLAALAVLIVALVPRTLGLDDFFTIDESYHWIGRSDRFATALAAGDWASTDQTGHPGVTTMWLGALGHGIAAALGIQNPGWAGGGGAYLALQRLPLAIANSLAVALGFLLLRLLVRPPVALLAACMWALSPFLIAHGRLLHLDALLTSLMTLSLLSLLVAIAVPPQGAEAPAGPVSRRWLLASGLLGGLALLTKAPSLLLLPVVGLALLAASASEVRAHRSRPALGELSALVRSVIVDYGMWLLAAAATFVLLWPAMWVVPLDAVGSIVREIRDNGGQPHHSGNYFLGQPVGVPDARFYPAVILWRTSPVTLIGLLSWPLLWIAWALRRQRMQPEERLTAENFTLGALVGFALLFTLALTVQAKMLDRYLLPIFPALEILAAAGLARAAALVWQAIRKGGRATLGAQQPPAVTRRSSPGPWFAAISAVALALAAQLALYHPYYLSYFNPLLGGSESGERVMLVGLGEGMEQVGAWLSARPDLGRGDVLSWIPPTLAPYVPKSTLVRDLRPAFLHQPSSYAVLYVRSVQHKESAEAEAYVRQSPALFTVRIHGVEYASVHQLPRPFAHPVDAEFGAGLHLRGFTSELVGSTLVITPSWDIQADMPGGVVSFVHVIGPDGARVGQVDATLDQGMFASWQAGQQFDGPLPVQLPPDLPAGEYRVVMGLYTPQTGERLALSRGQALPDSVAGPHALLLTAFTRP